MIKTVCIWKQFVSSTLGDVIPKNIAQESQRIIFNSVIMAFLFYATRVLTGNFNAMQKKQLTEDEERTLSPTKAASLLTKPPLGHHILSVFISLHLQKLKHMPNRNCQILTLVYGVLVFFSPNDFRFDRHPDGHLKLLALFNELSVCFLSFCGPDNN